MANASRIIRIHLRRPRGYSDCLSADNYSNPVSCSLYLKGYLSSTDLLVDFLTEMKQPFEFVILESHTGGVRQIVSQNGTNQTRWSGDLGFIERGEVDTSQYSFTVTGERAEDFEFSYPLRFIKSAFVFKAPEYVGSANVLVQAFTTGLWIALVTTLLAIFITIAFHYLAYLPNQKGFIFDKCSRAFWGIIWMFTGTQYDPNLVKKIDKRSKVSFRNALGFLSLFILFILSLYQSSLLSSLLSQRVPGTFQSTGELADLVRSKERYIVYSSTSYLSSVQSSNTAAFRKMNEALQANPAVKLKSARTRAQYLLDHPGAVFAGASAMKSESIAAELCGLTSRVDKDIDALQTTAFIFRKKDPILKELNQRIIGRGPYPMSRIEKSIKRRRKRNPELECPKPGPGDPLQFHRIIGVVYVCGVGFSVGLIALLIEIFVEKFVGNKDKDSKRIVNRIIEVTSANSWTVAAFSRRKKYFGKKSRERRVLKRLNNSK